MRTQANAARKVWKGIRSGGLSLVATTALSACSMSGGGEVMPLPPVASGPVATYADLATYADAAQFAIVATVDSTSTLSPERAPGVAPGMARLYVEAQTDALLAGQVPIGEEIAYLVDVPLTAEGKVPKIRNSQVILFARSADQAIGQAGAFQLVAPDAQLPATAENLSRVRAIFAELYAADAPPRITGIRDGLSVAGNLAGESETQLFLQSANRQPVTVTVLRRPNAAPAWGVSWSEIVDQTASAPAPNTIGWYRLACSLPAALPANALLTGSAADRQRATADYAFVLSSLGPCERNRT